MFLTRVNRSFVTSSLLYKVKGQIWIADLDLAIKIKERVFDIWTMLLFALVNLHERGLLGRSNYLCFPCITSRKEVHLISKPYYSSPWWTYTREAYWEGQTTSAFRVPLQGKRFIWLANHTIFRLSELTREGLIGKTKLPLLSVYYFKGRGSFNCRIILFSGLVNLRKREIHLGNHTTSALGLSLQGRGSFNCNVHFLTE